MRGRSGGGFGLLVLVIVAAIVMYLFARDTKSVAPTLGEIRKAQEIRAAQRVGAEVVPPADATSSAPETASPPALPRLGDMQQATGAHAAAVGDALGATNQ